MSNTFTEDSVRLKLDGQEVAEVVSYEVKAGVMQVPAGFTLTLGHGGNFAEIAAAYPPESRFELLIGDRVVQTGETDGFSTSGGGATEMRVMGRDLLRRIVDTHVENEQSYSEKTYFDLTLAALDAVGLGDRTIFAMNSANRKAITGSTVNPEIDKAVEETETDLGLPTANGPRTIYRTIKAEVGQTWWDFLSRQYQRAGLFLWADVGGNFVLSQPNGHQEPLYRILRRGRGDPSSVIGVPSFEHNTAHRYTECVVYGRGGGGKHGRGKVLGSFVDEEMVAILNPDPQDRADGGKRKKRDVVHDTHCRTKAHADALAKRRISESRQNGWLLTYTVAGHSAPALRGGGRVIWQPDTVVHVVDDELGIEGPMYVEAVTFKRTPYTHTVLKLIRIDDLIFIDEPPDVVKKRPKLQVRRGVTTVERPSFQLKGVSAGGQAVLQKTIWTEDPNAIRGPTIVVKE